MTTNPWPPSRYFDPFHLDATLSQGLPVRMRQQLRGAANVGVDTSQPVGETFQMARETSEMVGKTRDIASQTQQTTSEISQMVKENSQLAEENSQLLQEMNEGFAAIRKEMHEVFAATRTEIKALARLFDLFGDQFRAMDTQSIAR